MDGITAKFQLNPRWEKASSENKSVKSLKLMSPQERSASRSWKLPVINSDMASLFTRIVKGEIPCHKIAETEDFLAFLDINPLNEGHTLCIPKEETDYIFYLKEERYIGLHLFAKHIAEGLMKAVPCKRIGTAVLGLEVPHAHIHLIPVNSDQDLNFSRPRQKPADADLAATAQKIRAAL